MSKAPSFFDRNGRLLKVGQRVRFSVSTHYINTAEGTGSVIGFSDGAVLIESDMAMLIGNPGKVTRDVAVLAQYARVGGVARYKAHREMSHGVEWVEIWR